MNMLFIRSKPLLAFLFTILVTCRVSAADTIKTFVLTGQYVLSSDVTPDGTLDGTVTLDLDTGGVVSIDFDFVGRSPSRVRLAGGDFEDHPFTNTTELADAYGGNGFEYFAEDIVLPVGTFVGYSGGFICSDEMPCGVNSRVIDTVVSGHLLNGNLSFVPEPSSLLYLASALLPVVAYAKRRSSALQAV